jgi:hypothetical protein
MNQCIPKFIERLEVEACPTCRNTWMQFPAPLNVISSMYRLLSVYLMVLHDELAELGAYLVFILTTAVIRCIEKIQTNTSS